MVIKMLFIYQQRGMIARVKLSYALAIIITRKYVLGSRKSCGGLF